MTLGNEEIPSQPRTIDEFEDINPIKGSNSSGDKLINVAKRYGLNNMHDVIADYIDLGKNTQLTEIKSPQGSAVAYAPEIKVTVDIDNALEVQRKLTAAIVLLYANYLNDKFRTHWEHSFEPNGIFGATSADGFVTIERIGTPDTCLKLMDTYIDKLEETQKWHSKQLDVLNQVIQIIKESESKK